jgi:hypothetical protein
MGYRDIVKTNERVLVKTMDKSTRLKENSSHRNGVNPTVNNNFIVFVHLLRTVRK